MPKRTMVIAQNPPLAFVHWENLGKAKFIQLTRLILTKDPELFQELTKRFPEWFASSKQEPFIPKNLYLDYLYRQESKDRGYTKSELKKIDSNLYILGASELCRELGIPVVEIDCSEDENNIAILQNLAAQLKDQKNELGARVTFNGQEYLVIWYSEAHFNQGEVFNGSVSKERISDAIIFLAQPKYFNLKV